MAKPKSVLIPSETSRPPIRMQQRSIRRAKSLGYVLHEALAPS
jgi:hypothetical protein